MQLMLVTLFISHIITTIKATPYLKLKSLKLTLLINISTHAITKELQSGFSECEDWQASEGKRFLIESHIGSQKIQYRPTKQSNKKIKTCILTIGGKYKLSSVYVASGAAGKVASSTVFQQPLVKSRAVSEIIQINKAYKHRNFSN